MSLECPSCGTPPIEELENVRETPSEGFETHGMQVSCSCGSTYEIRYQATKIMHWPEDDSDPEIVQV